MRDFGEAPPPETFFERLKSGLSRSTAGLSDSLTGVFTKRPLDKETVAEFEEALIRADLGAAFASKLAAQPVTMILLFGFSRRALRIAWRDWRTASPVTAQVLKMIALESPASPARARMASLS